MVIMLWPRHRRRCSVMKEYVFQSETEAKLNLGAISSFGRDYKDIFTYKYHVNVLVPIKEIKQFSKFYNQKSKAFIYD